MTLFLISFLLRISEASEENIPSFPTPLSVYLCLFSALKFSLLGPSPSCVLDYFFSYSKTFQFSSVHSLNRVRLFGTPWIAAHQASLFITISRSSLRLTSIESVMPSSHPAIPSSVVPFSSCPQSLPASESFPVSQIFPWGGQSTGVSALASFLPNKSQGWSPCSPRDSQESSPTPQFKSINSSAISLLHSPTLTSIHDHCKNHSLD